MLLVIVGGLTVGGVVGLMVVLAVVLLMALVLRVYGVAESLRINSVIIYCTDT